MFGSVDELLGNGDAHQHHQTQDECDRDVPEHEFTTSQTNGHTSTSRPEAFGEGPVNAAAPSSLEVSPPAAEKECGEMSCSIPSITPTPSSERDTTTNTTCSTFEVRMSLEEERRKLRAKILEIRKQRAVVRRESEKVSNYSTAVFQQRNSAEADRMSALSRYRSATSGRASAEAQLAVLRTLDVTNDCFHIWHRGPYGTINGLRLGTEISPAASLSVSGDGGGQGSAGNTTSVGGGGAFDLSSMVAGAAASFFSDQNTTSISGENNSSAFDSLKVPWSETNAALGQVVLLLSVLQAKPSSGIVFKTHELIPMGACSKIGVRHTDGRATTEYGLFYSDESFSFFGKRNFNTALGGLFHCLKDVINVAARRDRTITPPHEVIIPSGRGEITIGGLPIAFDGSNGESWSKAMKYLLTDLKWLVAFTTKHIDR